MHEALVIRRAVEGDLAEVLQLERETGTAPHWGLAAYAAMLRAGEAGGVARRLFVAADGRVVSGFAVGSFVGDEAELESVVVREGSRRQGLGSGLVRAVIEWTKREGARAVRLEVRAGSGGALRLYGGMGFVAAGRRAGYYAAPVDDAVVMRLELAEKVAEPGLFG